MQKIILDTNILVSSLIQRGYPFLIVDELFTNNQIELCISSALIGEYYNVLQRKRFTKYPDFVFKAEALLASIEQKATFFSPRITLSIIKDFADNRLLELADECEANFLITGNTNDFTIASYKTTKIISPREYYENHCPL